MTSRTTENNLNVLYLIILSNGGAVMEKSFNTPRNIVFNGTVEGMTVGLPRQWMKG